MPKLNISQMLKCAGFPSPDLRAYHIGLLAQDVEKTTPHAVIEIGGFKAVDYRAATEASRRINRAV